MILTYYEYHMKQQYKQITPAGLYIVSTPIGNLRDITLRALDIFNIADLIVCEDTRVSGKLLSHYGIKKPLISYNDHNADEKRPEIIKEIKSGKIIALISDAGTPLISDPGYKLAREVSEQNLYITAIPGASSALVALCLSSLPSNQFFFAGFLPNKNSALEKYLKEISYIPATMIFFESAKRLEKSLTIMLEVFSDRQAAIARELTKLYEDVRRGKISELLNYVRNNPPLKGEIVIIVSPPQIISSAKDIDVESQLKTLLKSHSVKEAAGIIAEQTGKPRKEIYSAALKIKTPSH